MNQTTHPTLSPIATAGMPVGSIKALSVSAGIPNPPASFPRPIKALSVSAGIPTSPASLAHGPAFLTCRLPSPRSAFTLVELLVVIGIIATLAALVTPAVMRAQSAARNAAIKAEIDMLHMAIMNYKNEYGSFPPCISPAQGAGPAARHIARLFPRTFNLASQVQIAVNPENAIVGWLGGYTDDPTRPVVGSHEDVDYDLVLDAGEDINLNGVLDPLPRRKLFDFDQARITSAGGYHPSGKQASTYRYINSGQYAVSMYSGDTTALLANYGAHLRPTTPLPSKPNPAVPDAWYFTNTNAPAASSQQFFNPDTFQILCAGRDEQFGTDDDLSNFWPGTRRDYLDSLRD